MRVIINPHNHITLITETEFERTFLYHRYNNKPGYKLYLINGKCEADCMEILDPVLAKTQIVDLTKHDMEINDKKN